MNAQREARLLEALETIRTTLIREYQPEKIILFGSMASGVVGEWSDLDLLIVKETPLPFFKRLREVRDRCPVWIGVDFLVFTPEEMRQKIAEHDYFVVDEILKKGKILYEREPARAVA